MRKRPREIRGDSFYLKAYSRLSTERHFFNNATGPIPWTAIDTYGRRYKLNPLMHEWFVDLIRMLDIAYRDKLEKEGEDDAKRQRRQDRRDAKKAGSSSDSGIQKRRASAAR